MTSTGNGPPSAGRKTLARKIVPSRIGTATSRSSRIGAASCPIAAKERIATPAKALTRKARYGVIEKSSKNSAHHLAMHVGQSIVAALKAEDEPRVVDA